MGCGIEKDKELVDYGNRFLEKNKIILRDVREAKINDDVRTATLFGNTLPYFSYEELEQLFPNIKGFVGRKGTSLGIR